MADATKKKASAKKSEPKAEKEPRKRATSKLTMTQTKVVEGQFETRLKDLTALDNRLAEIEERFDNPDSFVPKQVAASRLKLGEALLALGEAKTDFENIGEQYRSFFG